MVWPLSGWSPYVNTAEARLPPQCDSAKLGHYLKSTGGRI